MRATCERPEVWPAAWLVSIALYVGGGGAECAAVAAVVARARHHGSLVKTPATPSLRLGASDFFSPA